MLRTEQIINNLQYYDEALTMSAMMAVNTGDLEWLERYKKFEDKFSAEWKEIIARTPSSSQALKTFTNSSNILFAIEEEAFGLLQKGQKEKAYSLLNTAAYKNQKIECTASITDLINGIREKLNEKVKENERRSAFSMIASFAVILLSGISWLLIIDRFKRWRKAVMSFIEEDKKLNWLNSGLTQLDEILRMDHDALDKLFPNIVNYIAKHMGAITVSLFIIKKDEDNNIMHLELASDYPLGNDSSKKFDIGEGLVGKAAGDRKMIIVNKEPQNSIKYNSGSGPNSKYLIIIPIIFEENLKGVIEISIPEEITQIQKEFLNRAINSTATILAAINRKKVTENLLLDSQELNKKLKSQEAELISSEIKLIKQQSNLQAALIKAEESAKSKSNFWQI